ncbi:hypothetical protein Zmor_000785 [Zophobas morio]|uniref:Secreted protein n=1 Tax=Zophobas morio TaxID=2755281 RepID=A0AA38J0T1_9CUCU|nr:hypothetical protein Zmor_000785 [Zophobas morio]
MALKSTFLLCAFLAFASAEIQPRDLADQVREELEALKSIVQGRILAAHDDLNNDLTDFRTNSGNVANAGTISIAQESQTVDQQLQAIKDLAHVANVDISPCTNVREQTLNRLPNRLTREMNNCISEVDSRASSTSSNGRYLVDIVINKVHNLEFQLRQCRDDLLCIAPLLTEIELDKIRLPQSVDTEVQAVQGLLTTLRLSVQTCSDSSVAQYITEAFGILGDIQACADRLIN